MSGLILNLNPGERVLINGAIIQNGEYRAKFSIKSPNTHILRLKDAIHPDEATTPVTRACYIAQLILSGDAKSEQGQHQLIIAIEQLSQVFHDADSRKILSNATRYAVKNDVYRTLRQLKELLPREARLLATRSQ